MGSYSWYMYIHTVSRSRRPVCPVVCLSSESCAEGQLVVRSSRHATTVQPRNAPSRELTIAWRIVRLDFRSVDAEFPVRGQTDDAQLIRMKLRKWQYDRSQNDMLYCGTAYASGAQDTLTMPAAPRILGFLMLPRQGCSGRPETW